MLLQRIAPIKKSASRSIWQRFACGVAALSWIGCSWAEPQAVPPVVPGFPNVPQTAGALLAGLVAPNQGRTAIIAYQNGILYTEPESPDSLQGSDLQVRSWSLANPAAPQQLALLGVTRMSIDAHGYFHYNGDLVLGNTYAGLNWTFRAGVPGTNIRMDFPEFDRQCAGMRGCVFYPWVVSPTLWSYAPVQGTVELRKLGPLAGWGSQPLSSWNVVAETGVIGHPFLLGNLLFFASEDTRTGIAAYDISDPANPALLSVFNTGAPGGYWPEIFGYNGHLYLVFPYRTDGNGFRVVDITDPNNMQFVADRALPGNEVMYIQFQDEYAFMADHKVDMRTFESVLDLNGAARTRTSDGLVGIDTSQFSLPLGNLLITGGTGTNQGMAVWAHQSAPDTRGPSVGYHVPRNEQANYPVGAPISLLIHETLEPKTIVVGTSLIVQPSAGGPPLTGSVTFSFDDILTFTPSAPLDANTSYDVIVLEGGIKDAAGNGIEGLSFSFSTGGSVSSNAAPIISSFSADGSPALTGGSVTLSAVAQDPEGQPLEYRFDPGDGTAGSGWTTNPSFAHIYAQQGHFRASLQVRDAGGRTAAASRVVTVMMQFPPDDPPALAGSGILALPNGHTVSVNPDDNSVSVINATGTQVIAELAVCADPRAVAAVGTQELWVVCHDDDSVVVVNRAGYAVTATLPLAHGSRPIDIVTSVDGASVYVTTYGRGELLRFNAASRAVTDTLPLGPTARAIALSPDGARAYVTRFISPRSQAEVWDIQLSNLTLSRTLVVRKFGGEANRDTSASGRGVANYLSDIAVSPDGSSLWFTAIKANVERGVLISPNTDLDTDNTLRAIAVEILLAAGPGQYQTRRVIDIDNSDSPSALGFSPLGDYLFVALQGNNQLAIFDLLAEETIVGPGALRGRSATGFAPNGIAVDRSIILVQNFLGRSVTRFNSSELLAEGNPIMPSTSIVTVSNEIMPANVLNGKRIFYNASDLRMTDQGYLSCASCHVDGDSDGRTWDFTGRGEGLRNTVSLRGRAGMGHGLVHWSGNFDEIQDFENDIRNAFGGAGFLTNNDFATTSNTLGPAKAGRDPDLDDLAAYVSSLGNSSVPRSPWRQANGSMTAQAIAGQAVFNSSNCQSCHTPPNYTSSTGTVPNLVNVGTLTTNSGGRLGAALTGIDVPTLLNLFDSAPYLHDGSATTLPEVFSRAGGVVIPAESGVTSYGAELDNPGFLGMIVNYDDTVRGRQAVVLQNPGSRLQFNNVNGGSGGLGAVEIRYSTSNASQISIRVNGGAAQVVNLPATNQSYLFVQWNTIRVENIQFAAGAGNTILIERTSPYGQVGVDEILVTSPTQLTAAAPHRNVLALSASDRDALLRFLLELEPEGGGIDPDPIEGVIFANSFE